jgi:TonB family protein
MIRAAACLLLLLAAPAAAQAPGPKLGEWIKAGSEDLLPNAGLDIYLLQKPQPGLYRHVKLSWEAPQAPAYYPAAAFAARQEGEVLLSMDVGADGRPTACRITRSSRIAALDEHSCGHVMTRSRFVPALTDKGRRIGGTVEGRMSYNLRAVTRPALIGDTGWNYPAKRAAPLQPVTLQALGIPAGAKLPRGADSLKAMLAVNAKGRVTACLLTYPTFDDALDQGACDRLRKLRFSPALDRQGRPMASIDGVDLPLPR